MAQPETFDIDALIALARRRDAAARGMLADQTRDLFLDRAGRLSDRARQGIIDVLTRLIENTVADLSMRLEERLRALDIGSPGLRDSLGDAMADPVRELLMRRRVLDLPILVQRAKWRVTAHRIALSLRQNGLEDFGFALPDPDREDIVTGLSEHSNAEIAAAAMNYLVAEARLVDRFQDPVLRFTDLPAETAADVFWLIVAGLRQVMIEQHDAAPTLIDLHLEEAARPAAPTAMDEPEIGETLADLLLQQGELSAELMLGGLRQGRLPLFLALLSRLTGLGLDTATFIVFEGDGEGLAIACKAADLPRETFVSLLILSRAGLETGLHDTARQPEWLTRSLDLFDETEPRAARAALRYWRRESAYLAALRRIEEPDRG